MKISIITVCYNAGKTIRHTLESVLGQSYADIEYIVVDGGSKDETFQIINEYSTKISRFISEPDRGMYDAINKGIGMATGDIIAILNADDVYANREVIEKVVSRFSETGTMGLYGDLVYVDFNNPDKIVRKWISGSYRTGDFLKGWMPPHPAFFVRREAYEKYGMFRTDLKTAADYELMLRMIHKHEITLSYLPGILVKMRTGGMSNNSMASRINANKEDRRAW
jgi:glycosyltransferase involved in cell wall biosynthesis